MARRSERASLALRGAAAVSVLVVGAVTAVVGSAGVFTAEPEVTTTLPAAAGPVRESTPVQYRGIKVGELSQVVPDDSGARLTMKLDPERIGEIPADVRVRLLPRTLFGNQYLDLTGPGLRDGTRLADGAHVPPDTSRPTAQLYTTYTRMYRLLDELEPAQLQVALTAMADSLRGRGEQLGGMIDDGAALVDEADPILRNLGSDLETMAAVGDDLRAAAPDLVRSLDNAVALSTVVVEQREDIGALLGGGIEVTDRAQRFLDANGERTVELVRSADPITDVLGANPGAFGNAKAGVDTFLDGANRAFSTGFFKIRAKASLEDPHPYTPQDCPRYGALSGPNCGRETAIGPVGSPQEDETMRRLAPLLPTPEQAPPAAPPSPDLLGLMLGPMVRGTEVMTP
ncbi:MCE family protein [Saccharopolyspora sp. ID03-671]|uniref:MCE family protein n=1 Tax=Saccharopolyspora sp. ID03-671 TaxID=3073066 RepID=UPI00324BA1F7